MTQVPEAITAELREIEDRLEEARQKQNDDSLELAALGQREAHIRERIAARRREMRDWKMQRKTLRYAVDAIEGRVIHLGTIEAAATEPFLERVVVERSPPRIESTTHVSPKESVHEALKRLGRPGTPAEITEKVVGLNTRAVGASLGRLRKEGKAIRTEEGLWGPAHQ